MTSMTAVSAERYPSQICIISSMLKVFFDGACPMCVREVAVYRRQSPPDISWVNLALPELDIPSGRDGSTPSRAALLSRFHVYTAEQRWLHGAPAFTALWSRLGRPWRMLSLIGKMPGGLWTMDKVYALFLKLRPALQRAMWHMLSPQYLPAPMVADFRSDQAGETGAVWIYRAMLMCSRDQTLREMLLEHQSQELQHLAAINRLLPWRFRSRLLPLWRVAGFVTGVVAALGGRNWTLATIASVESFVDSHYREQIERLTELESGNASPAVRGDCRAGDANAPACSIGVCELPAQPDQVFSGHPNLLSLLHALREDELRHRADALGAMPEPSPDESRSFAAPVQSESGTLLRLWCGVVGKGSAVAVRLARVL
jgi:demethoxyubiquinone hydroxylase (CLK1/Coq7/Cat5 family)/predicted DCC family thiol-disulfide oxidoreductase YuxK